jgi:ubiquinone/menaquinone biosynthesis C-methylase UbiE
MQTFGTGGALRFPFPRRLQRTAYRAQREFAFLQRFFTPRSVFMEIGAADCDLALQAAGYIERVYAVDVAGRLLDEVLVPCNLRLVLCDGVHIPMPEASVDVAWSGRFLAALAPGAQLEHLKSVRRALAPGGVYLTSVFTNFIAGGFSAVQCYFGGLRVPLAAARFFPPEKLRYAAR